MGFSRQGYWSELPFPSPGDLPDPGIEPGFPTLQPDALSSEPPGKPNFSGIVISYPTYNTITITVFRVLSPELDPVQSPPCSFHSNSDSLNMTQS